MFLSCPVFFRRNSSSYSYVEIRYIPTKKYDDFIFLVQEAGLPVKLLSGKYYFDIEYNGIVYFYLDLFAAKIFLMNCQSVWLDFFSCQKNSPCFFRYQSLSAVSFLQVQKIDFFACLAGALPTNSDTCLQADSRKPKKPTPANSARPRRRLPLPFFVRTS